MLKFSTTKKFDKQLRRLDEKIQNIFTEKLEYFLENPKYSSLNTEKLQSNLYSFRVTKNFRVIFKYQETKEVLLIFIAKHDIYKKIKDLI